MNTRTRQAPHRPGRAPLSRQRVLAAALGYVDEHGLDGLTMHKLAVQLGVGDMSLYNHVRNKDDLLTGIRGLVWAEIAAALPPAGDDASWLRALGHAIRDAGHRHPQALPAVTAGTGFPPAMLEAIASRFGRDGAAGPDPRLVNGIATVTAFALGWAITATRVPAPQTERQLIRRVTAALPPDTPDRLVDTAITVCVGDADAAFAAGLDAVINGCGLGATRS